MFCTRWPVAPEIVITFRESLGKCESVACFLFSRHCDDQFPVDKDNAFSKRKKVHMTKAYRGVVTGGDDSQLAFKVEKSVKKGEYG